MVYSTYVLTSTLQLAFGHSLCHNERNPSCVQRKRCKGTRHSSAQNGVMRVCWCSDVPLEHEPPGGHGGPGDPKKGSWEV